MQGPVSGLAGVPVSGLAGVPAGGLAGVPVLRHCHQVQEFPVPLRVGDHPAAQGGQVGTVGLENRDSRTVGAVDDEPVRPLPQEAG